MKKERAQRIISQSLSAALYETGGSGIPERLLLQEHYCTSAVQQIIAGFYPDIMKNEKKGMKMVASCVPGELHEVGVRMVADFFELSGWETIYLGSNVPVTSIIHLLKTQKIPLLALSCTMSMHLGQTDTIIRMIREDTDLQGIKIIVGGYPFRKARDLWRRMGRMHLHWMQRMHFKLGSRLLLYEYLCLMINVFVDLSLFF
jgi:methanogenic corrinoid protein MtbC1